MFHSLDYLFVSNTPKNYIFQISSTKPDVCIRLPQLRPLPVDLLPSSREHRSQRLEVEIPETEDLSLTGRDNRWLDYCRG